MDPHHAEGPAHADPRLAEKLTRVALGGGLALVLGLLALAQLATWIPHYLDWPLYPDHDVFATAAQSWDAGLRPYRDYATNNLPGTIYLFWILGKIAGWGEPRAFFAADALAVAGFAGLLVAWSARRFRSSLPGLVAVLAFLSYYLDLNYAMAAQRDWHAPALALGGLLLTQIFRGRLGLVLSAAGAALALTFRPQAVVFLPAFLAQVALDRPEDDGADRSSFGFFARALTWLVVFAVVLALGYAPIALQGLMGDLVRGIRLTAPGSSYNQLTASRFVAEFAKQFGAFAVIGVILAILLRIGPARSATRAVGRVWLVVLAGVLVYKPMSPFPHLYLDIPLRIVWAVLCGLLVELILESGTVAASFRLAAILLVLGLGVILKPQFSNPGGSLQALRAWRSGETPTAEPNGYRPRAGLPAAAYYPWADYRATLDYLRAETKPSTKVANCLKEVPALTGPSGRLSAFPAESIAWLKMVRRDDEARFARALETAEDIVVVWIPDEVGLLRDFQTPLIDAVIRERFRFDRRFGAIEIWIPKTAETPGEPSGELR